MSATTENPASATAPVVEPPVVPQSALPTDPLAATTTEAPAAAGEAAPAAEAKPTEAAAAAEGTSTEKTVGDNKAEVTAVPVTSGVLGYKAPGVLTQFRFKKQYFWLGDEAVTTKDLHQYLRGTKPEIAHPVAAWASQTGKGLLFSSKDEKKGAIADVVPLADATYITKEGTQDLAFRQGPKKHQHKFQASSQDERNGWVVAISAAHEEAKKHKETIEASDGYKASLKELKEPSKPATSAAVAGTAAAVGGTAAATAVVTSKDAKDSKETPNEPTAAKETTKEPEAAKPKERSQSRKRASIFGGFGKKKEEKAEEKDAKKEEKETKKEEEKEEKKAEKEEPKKAEEGAAAAATVAAPAAVVAETEDKKEEKKEEPAKKEAEKPTTTGSTERSKSKRRSGIFGLFDKAKSEVKKEETKVVDAFKDDPTAAPGHSAASSVKKEEKEVVEAFKDDPTSPEAAKKENVAPAAAATSADKSATSPSEKRRSSFFGLGQKFGSVRNKQPKAAETKAEESKPEAVAESKTEPVAATAETDAKPAEPEVAKAEPTKAIGDVVPEAVSVGQEQPPNGTVAAPAVASTA